jgi:hypothetical protein
LSVSCFAVNFICSPQNLMWVGRLRRTERTWKASATGIDDAVQFVVGYWPLASDLAVSAQCQPQPWLGRVESHPGRRLSRSPIAGPHFNELGGVHSWSMYLVG